MQNDRIDCSFCLAYSVWSRFQTGWSLARKCSGAGTNERPRAGLACLNHHSWCLLLLEADAYQRASCFYASNYTESGSHGLELEKCIKNKLKKRKKKTSMVKQTLYTNLSTTRDKSLRLRTTAKTFGAVVNM